MTHPLSKNMTTKLATVELNTPLSVAYKLMHEKSIRHLPVVDAKGDVLGVLSDRDLARAMNSKFVDMGSVKVEQTTFDNDKMAQDYMSYPVLSVQLGTSLKRVTERMIKEKVSCFMVVEGFEVVGIITTEDLLKVLADLLDDEEPKSRWNLETLVLDPMFLKVTQTVSDTGL
jgi:CBS domain-containing protein